MTVCLYSCLSYPACRAHAQYILAYVGCLAVQYISTLSHTRRDFRKKVLNTKFVFWLSLQLLSEIFLILRRIERDIITKLP
jgi:hypothetical protein